jgi:phosphoribosylformylglycinamidine (FGAM) synthase PurS component
MAKKNVEMSVTLKIPDATALTALRTLHEVGYKELKNLHRALYYSFDIDGDEKNFKKKIATVDILVNANKHTASFPHPFGKDHVLMLVADKEQGDGLAKRLREQLGIKEVKSTKTGTLWAFEIGGKDKETMAQKMAEELLANRHYQTITRVK